MAVSRKTEVNPQDAELALAAANMADAALVVDLNGQPMPTGPDGLQVLTDATPAWKLPDGHVNLLGKFVTLSDDKAGVVTNTGVGATGLGMIELDGDTLQHASNVVDVREPTAKERKASATA